MPRLPLAPLAGLSLLIASGAVAEDHFEPPLPVASAGLRTTDGDNVGTATFTPGNGGVLIHLQLSGLEPGAKGVHLHAVGSCDPETDFGSAGPHIGDDGSAAHGVLHPQGPHAGDLPNVYVGQNGGGEAQFYTTRVNFDGVETGLLDSDGSAIILHAERDDQFTQPGGTTAGRIACGELVTP